MFLAYFHFSELYAAAAEHFQWWPTAVFAREDLRRYSRDRVDDDRTDYAVAIINPTLFIVKVCGCVGGFFLKFDLTMSNSLGSVPL